MGVQTELDYSGMTLVVKDVRVNSANVGDTGTSLSTTEFAFLDGAAAANTGTNKTVLTGTSGAVTLAGALTPAAGIVAALGTAGARLCATGGEPAVASTDGTDSTPSVTETYYAELFVPCNVSVTGVALFNGSATGSGNVTAYLTNSAGTNLAHTASTAISGTDAYQRIAFVGAPIAVLGPGTYYIATQYDNTNTRFNTHTVGNFGAGKDTSTVYGTFPTATIPTTFTTALGPIAGLY